MAHKNNHSYSFRESLFKAGNKAAEKWTGKTVVPILNAMWEVLCTDDEGQLITDRNYVRANDIKTAAEICLMFDVCPDTWTYWQRKMKESPTVLRLIKKIRWVLEARLNYSGTAMDIFILKNHYEYTDQHDVTSKGKDINDPFLQMLKESSFDTSDEED